MKKCFCLLAIIVLLILSACQRESTSPQLGKQAPDFTLANLSGQSVRLMDLRGKVVLLNFWASWCPPCREEVPSLVKLNKAMSGKDFRMLAVSIEQGGVEAVEKYFRNAGIRLPALVDADGKVGKTFGITGVPETFIIDKQGVIRKKVVGPIDWDDPSVIQYLQELANA
jgi:DsbE subfamily thiol:disulfide oxidoreductase